MALEAHTELTLLSALHPPSWTSHTSLPEPPGIRSAAHPERINSMRFQTSPLAKLLPAAAGDVHRTCSVLAPALCGSIQLDGSGQGLPGARGGSEPWPQEQSWVTPHPQLCSCHTVQGSEPPFSTHRHTPGGQGGVSHQGQPPGPWLIPSCCHGTEPHTGLTGRGHTPAAAPDPPCL